MRDHGVVAVAREVLALGLPVRPHDVAHRGAHHLHATLELAQDGFQVPGDIAEVLAQRRPVGVPGGEYQPQHRVDLGGLKEREVILVKALAEHVGLIGDAAQFAGVRIGPAVVATAVVRGIALVGTAERHPAVAAGVEEHPNLAVLAAGHDDLVAAHLARDVVARLGDLTLVREVLPAVLEDAIHLEEEDVLVGPRSAQHRHWPILRPGDPSPIRVDTHRAPPGETWLPPTGGSSLSLV